MGATTVMASGWRPVIFTPVDHDVDLTPGFVSDEKVAPVKVVCIDDSAIIADLETVARCRIGFRGHSLMASAQKQMADEMATFPWRSMTELEQAQEMDAQTAGFRTARQANEEQVKHVRDEMTRLLVTGSLEDEGRAVVLAVSDDEQPRARTRGLVLALQMLINEYGLPAFILDSEETGHTDNEGNTFTRHVAELAVIWPR